MRDAGPKRTATASVAELRALPTGIWEEVFSRRHQGTEEGLVRLNATHIRRFLGWAFIAPISFSVSPCLVRENDLDLLRFKSAKLGHRAVAPS